MPIGKVIPIHSIGQRCSYEEIRNIKVTDFSNKTCTAIEFEENHRHEHYEIVWLKRGAGIHTVDTIDYPYSGSILFLLSPGQMHKIKPTETAEGHIVKFLPALFADTKDMEEYLLDTSLFDNIEAQPLLPVSASLHVTLEELFSKLNAEFNANEQDKEKIMLAYLKIMITHISRLKRSIGTQRTQLVDSGLKLMRDYKIAVEKNFVRQHSVQFYADFLSTQTRTLNSVSKKFLGKTAGEIIDDRILLQAKRELFYGATTIKEVAFALGFEDPAYFTRFFRKMTGLSPLEYKEELNQPKMLKRIDSVS